VDVEDVVLAVMRQFGDETGAQINQDDIFRWINEGQFQISRKIGDSEATAPPIPTVNGTYKYALPTDFFKVQFAELEGIRLQWLTPAMFRNLFTDIDSAQAQFGAPKFFTIASIGVNQAQISLAPIPSGVLSLTVVYNRRPPIINATTDELTIPEEYRTTLVTYCLAKAKQLDGDDEGFVTMTAAFKNEVTEDSHDSRHKDEETYPVIRPSAADVWSSQGDVW
jgi:hypothetical protein